jgi:uncharacterized protein (TIGR00303 family)
MFMVFISETELCKVPGVTSAGADVEAVPYTAPADADLLFYDKPRVIDCVPVDPYGHPTPALITKAAIIEGKIPVMAVRAGTSIAPAAPYIEISGEPGHDPRFGKAVPDYEEIIVRASALARGLAASLKHITIGESLPGGTTTALMLLRALGHEGTVSSADPVNPIALKEELWQAVCNRLNITTGGLKGKGFEAAAEVGDPMQIAVAAFVNALPEDVEVTLAGGTQMIAVVALLRDLGDKRPILVATTKYVYNDPTGCMPKYAQELDVKTYAAQLDFSKSQIQGLADYEKGFVKEGVGMGGAVLYALNNGAKIEDITKRTEKLYIELTKK